MNGRFLQEDFHGEMMGKPFHGRTLLGYNNVKQTFNSVWVDDMNTAMFCSEGKGENGNKVITLEGKASCPATNRTDIPMKVVLRVNSPDKHVFEMFDTSLGEKGKTMEGGIRRNLEVSGTLCLGRFHCLPFLHRHRRGDKPFAKLQRKLVRRRTPVRRGLFPLPHDVAQG